AQVHQPPDDKPLGVIFRSPILHPGFGPAIILLLTLARQHLGACMHLMLKVVKQNYASIFRTCTFLRVGPPGRQLRLAQGFLGRWLWGFVHRGPPFDATVGWGGSPGRADRQARTSRTRSSVRPEVGESSQST